MKKLFITCCNKSALLVLSLSSVRERHAAWFKTHLSGITRENNQELKDLETKEVQEVRPLPKN
jgi:hypothetical protein